MAVDRMDRKMNLVTKLADFGMVVLIWMTQLIVYPGFTFYSEQDLISWHSQYTYALIFIVGPLMLVQGLSHGYQLLRRWTFKQGIIVLLLLVVWVITFGFAVPMHNEIAQGNEPLLYAQKLVELNRYRTIVWTLVFLLSLLWIKDPMRKEQIKKAI
jgi:hypothetical protein